MFVFYSSGVQTQDLVYAKQALRVLYVFVSVCARGLVSFCASSGCRGIAYRACQFPAREVFYLPQQRVHELAALHPFPCLVLVLVSFIRDGRGAGYPSVLQVTVAFLWCFLHPLDLLRSVTHHEAVSRALTTG